MVKCWECAMVSALGSMSCFLAVAMVVSLFFFKLYKKTPGRLLLSLALYDICHSIGIQTSYHWIYSGIYAGSVCSFQGWILTFADLGSSLSVLMIAFYTLYQGIYGKYWDVRYEIASYGFVFIFTGVLSFAQLGVPLVHNNAPFFNNSGTWCWISQPYDLYRFVLQYLYIYMSFIMVVLMYGLMAFKLWRITKYSLATDKASQRKNMRKIFKKIAGYPFVYFLSYFPLGTVRLIAWSGHVANPHFVIFAVITMSLTGFMNAIVYGFSRNIFVRYWHMAKELKLSFTNSSQSTGASSEHNSKEVQLPVFNENETETDGEEGLSDSQKPLNSSVA